MNEAIETFSLEGLREDTVYEYRVGFAENDSAAANDLKRTAEGELKTAKDARTVEAAFEPRAYSVRIRYALSDMEGADDGYLLGYVRKSSGTGDSAWKNVCAIRTGEEATEDDLSTVMYYTGLDPRTMEKVYVPTDPHEKAMQRALIQYRDPKNYSLVREALIATHREDLIGSGSQCLIRAVPPRALPRKKPAVSKPRPKRK